MNEILCNVRKGIERKNLINIRVNERGHKSELVLQKTDVIGVDGRKHSI